MPSLRLPALVGLLLAAAVSPRAAAADGTGTCVQAAHDGQRLRDVGKLGEAEEALVTCSAPTCPAVVRDYCVGWLADVRARRPSIVLGARDARGNDLYEVRVLLDGRDLATRLDGRAVAVDPGPHRLSFEARGRRTVRQFVVIREGEKGRTIVAVFAEPDDRDSHRARAASPSRRRAGPMLVAGGVAAAGLAGFAVFGLWGQSERDHLADTCAPTRTCPEDEVAAARTKLVIADVSLVVGVVGAAALTAMLVSPLFADDSAPARPAVGWRVSPLDRGLLVGIERRY